MKNALLWMIALTGLAIGAPINGGSCNGGGTMAEFNALTQGCSQFGWEFDLGSSGSPLLQVQLSNNSLLGGHPSITIAMSGLFEEDAYIFRMMPSAYRGFEFDRFVQRSLVVVSGDPANVLLWTPFATRYFEAGEYATEVTYNYVTPESQSFVLVAAGLAVVIGWRRRPRPK